MSSFILLLIKDCGQKNSTEKNSVQNSADEKGYNVNRLADAITPDAGLDSI